MCIRNVMHCSLVKGSLMSKRNNYNVESAHTHTHTLHHFVIA